jgi:molybdopterin molybdotransferase
VITTGGVSVGEADFIRQMMAKLGEVLFWKIAMRPGGRWRSAASATRFSSACRETRWR